MCLYPTVSPVWNQLSLSSLFLVSVPSVWPEPTQGVNTWPLSLYPIGLLYSRSYSQPRPTSAPPSSPPWSGICLDFDPEKTWTWHLHGLIMWCNKSVILNKEYQRVSLWHGVIILWYSLTRPLSSWHELIMWCNKSVILNKEYIQVSVCILHIYSRWAKDLNTPLMKDKQPNLYVSTDHVALP